ncbi:MAG: hypothetical protein WB586_03750 [Chthoniobacterales bacterium]
MKPSEEERAQQRAAELEKLRQSLFNSNKSTDPRLVTAAVQPSVSLMAPVQPPAESPKVSGGGEQFAEHVIEQPAPLAAEALSEEPPIQPIETSLAEAMRKFRAPDEVNRSNVRVSDDVFSRVTAFFVNNPVSKLDILTYLLFTYLPRVTPSGRAPPWLLEVPPESLRHRNLVYLEDQSLSDRFTQLTAVHGVSRVDLIENIVRHYLPPPSRLYPPKRRRRRSA